MTDKPIRLMLDLETLSTSSDAKILTIGIYQFDNPINIFPFEFYERCDPTEKSGHESVETLDWWSKQDSAVRAETFSGVRHLKEVLLQLDAEVRARFGCDLDKIEIWSKGADFDIPILKAAFDRSGIEYPFNFRLQRCYRTLEGLVNMSMFGGPSKNSNSHSALEDAKNQASKADAILNYLLHRQIKVT